MLRGNYLATVDEKGRLKIPADFLADLRKSGTKFYVTSTKGDRAAIYPLKAWEEIEKKLAKYSTRTQRIGGDEGGSGRPGAADVPGSLESQPVPGSNEP